MTTIAYKFIFPADDYVYSGDFGCVAYLVHRGSGRQVKINMSNLVNYNQNVAIEIRYQLTNSITYSVASTTGGTVANVPIDGNEASFVWTANNMPRANYELTLNIIGATGALPSETGVYLRVLDPCTDSPSLQCDSDEVLRLLVAD